RKHPENYSQQIWDKKGQEFLQYFNSIPELQKSIGKNKLKTNISLSKLCDLVVNFLDSRQYLENKINRRFESGITIVTACMNRNDNLFKAIQTWVQCREINQIVIVDWASNTPVTQSLSDINDPRICIVRTNEPKR
ncbi:hypothetical protein V6O07_14105, partial [Arthrospira platensis SPKY2]